MGLSTGSELNMSNQEAIRVLCVDDHPLMREGINLVLNSQPDMRVVAQASNGREAIKCFGECRPDVTVMDLRLPDMSGIDALIAIQAKFPDARIIILTTFEGDTEIQRALAAGARSYILKSMGANELAETIRQVRAGKKRIPPQVAAQLAEHLSDEALTDREIEVLRHVSAGNSNKIIADELALSEHTIKGHLKNILSKLGASDRTQAVTIALRRGLLQV
jgi:DNA-binding NarL/FixJ family response regulator